MNKVFITGADGMLGSSICRELIHQKYSVRAFCLNDRLHQNLDGLDIEITYGNILNTEDIEKNLQGCDYIIHVAASTVVWPKRSALIREINLKGTQNITEVAKRLSIVRMVHIGTASSFANGGIDSPSNEKAEYNGWQFGMDYLDSKYEAQMFLISEFNHNKFPVIIINPTYMIGPFDAGPSSGKMIISFCKSQLPGFSNGGKNFVFSKDVAVAAVNALHMGQLGQCYIAGNENLSYEDFFKKVAKASNIEFKLRLIPYWLVLVVGVINSIVARIIRKAPKLSYGIARMSNNEQYFKVEKARAELKMPSTAIDEAISTCIKWFKENKYL